jgi:hypothetical protein
MIPMDNKDLVIFGYLPDFYYDSEPALVFIGSNTAMVVFSEYMRKVAVDKSQSPYYLNDVELFFAMNNTILRLSIEASSVGVKKLDSTVGNEIQWTLSPSQAIYFSKVIRQLSESSKPAHQYLDCGSSNDLNVIVSVGEYTKNIFKPT